VTRVRRRSRLGKAKGLTIGLGAGLVLAGGLASYAGVAGAAPQPNINQVKAEVSSLQSKVDMTGQQYDQAGEQLTAARNRLTEVQREAAAAQARFVAARSQVAQIAALAYEYSGQDSVGSLLTSNDPSVVLSHASMLTQMAGTRSAEVTQFLTVAQQLAQSQQSVQRTEYGVAALRGQLAARKTSLNKLLASKQATLDSLNAQQQAAVTAADVGAQGATASTGAQGTGSQSTGSQGNTTSTQGSTSSTGSQGSTSTSYTGPTSTQGEKAVAFAFAQIGKPYLWGGTGPGAYDCSGLVQAAWAYAGIAIPRDTYEQWGALPHINSSALEPGDLLFFDGIGHVAIYVGNGNMIDAPQTGETIRELSTSNGWYAANFVGAARP
jgi:peptidoglycan DL-endopeptidase CwlO